jgi:hypothetical protein
MNGRVDITDNVAPFQLFEDSPSRTAACAGGSGLANRGKTELSEVFFSVQNMDALQEAIRYQVYVQSNGKHTIGRQSEVELEIIMRSVFLEHARNLPFDILGQVRRLNGIVLKQTVPKVIREVEMYLAYRKDISSLPVPLERAQNVSKAGTRSLALKEF